MKRKKIWVMDRDSLEKLHTGSLMTRRTRLLACEQRPEMSDQDGGSIPEEGAIEFKSDPRWQQAYSNLLHVLSARENWPHKKKHP